MFTHYNRRIHTVVDIRYRNQKECRKDGETLLGTPPISGERTQSFIIVTQTILKSLYCLCAGASESSHQVIAEIILKKSQKISRNESSIAEGPQAFNFHNCLIGLI